MDEINPLPDNYHQALKLIDEAHARDPRSAERESGSVPFELDYAQHMTRWLALREPGASPVLQLACRAQHFRRFVFYQLFLFADMYNFFSHMPKTAGKSREAATP